MYSREYRTIILLCLFPPRGYVGEDAFHLISVMCRSHVSFSSIFYSQFTININLQVSSNKFIVNPPPKSYVIYLRYFLPIYVTIPIQDPTLESTFGCWWRDPWSPKVVAISTPFSFCFVVPVIPAASLQYSRTSSACCLLSFAVSYGVFLGILVILSYFFFYSMSLQIRSSLSLHHLCRVLNIMMSPVRQSLFKVSPRNHVISVLCFFHWLYVSWTKSLRTNITGG